MFPIHISLVQVCSLNRKFLGCWIQLDYCNLVFFPSHCISEQPLSDILHHCLSAGAISPSVGLHWNVLFKEYSPKQVIQFNLQMTLHQLWVHWPVFVSPANTLRCQNSAMDAVFLLLFAAKMGRWGMNRSFWPWLEGTQEKPVIGAASAAQTASFATHPVSCHLPCIQSLCSRADALEKLPRWAGASILPVNSMETCRTAIPLLRPPWGPGSCSAVSMMRTGRSIRTRQKLMQKLHVEVGVERKLVPVCSSCSC